MPQVNEGKHVPYEPARAIRAKNRKFPFVDESYLAAADRAEGVKKSRESCKRESTAEFKSFQRLLNIHGRSGLNVKDGAGEEDMVKEGAEEDSRMASMDKREVLYFGSGKAGVGDGGFGRSLGPGRSPPKHKYIHPADSEARINVNVNDKDGTGRTALHLACSLPDCLEYVRLLLKHPSINVNVQDMESHYTPLHRALYMANFPAALSVILDTPTGLYLLLLQRPDIDATLKDYEGYTPFDLYNSTIEGTKPHHNDPDGELFMWGPNVNATLGFSDGNNRSHPDQIVIQPKEYCIYLPDPGPTLQDRFSPIHVRQAAMSRLHTVVVTSEGCDNLGGGNLRVCGFGSSGRLGPSPCHHAQQYALSALPSHAFPTNVHIVKVAVGQDHTLALTKSGEVYSWGFNRFSQLGYVVRAQGEVSGVPGNGTGGTSGWSHDAKIAETGRWDGRIAEVGTSSDDTIIQQVPRRLDSLKKETVVGIAASKMASACWTKKGDIYTWGTNSGQLGYEKSSHLQVLPRKVSRIVGRVTDVALSDTAMACLISTGDVICVWNDKEIKLNFPIQTFPSKIQPYRPPQALRDAGIAKLTTCDDIFAALSLNGEVFVFTAPDGSSGSGEGSSARKMAFIKPQRAWVLKKKFSAVKDVALGANGNIIVCTESGHVFVRTRAVTKGSNSTGPAGDKGGMNSGSAAGSLTSSSLTGTGVMAMPSVTQPGKVGTNFSFVRVPSLQRVTKVYANSTGAFGALKVDYRHAPIKIVGNGLAEDLKDVMPFVAMYDPGGGGDWWRVMKKGGRRGLELKSKQHQDDVASPSLEVSVAPPMDPEDTDFDDIKEDILQLRRFCELVELERKERKDYPKDRRLPFDADVMVVSQSEAAFPAHRVVLAARSTELCSVLSGGKAVRDDKTNITVRFVSKKGKQENALTIPRVFPSVSTCGKLFISGCHVLTTLILLAYLYSDELLALWDPRVKGQLQEECEQVKVKPDQVRGELQVLARLLDLPFLSDALGLWVKRVPAPSIPRDTEKLWLATQPPGHHRSEHKASHPLAPDVLLQLEDCEVWCHSVLLRARSDLFASFFGEEVWTVDRWDDGGVIKVDMRHLGWHVMQYVLRFIFCGSEEAQFDHLGFVKSVDDVLEFMFSVLAVATELLLDRLVLICSSVIIKHTNIQNACYVLNDATTYDANQLIERLQRYMVVNLETIFEQGLLDDCPYRLVKQLAAFAREKQAEKSPASRTTVLIDAAMEKHGEFLALEDIPEPILCLSRPHGPGINIKSRRPRLSFEARVTSSAPDSPIITATPQRTIRRPPSGEDIFIMDDAPITDVSSPGLPQIRHSVWKPHHVLRVDMKSVMAEEAASVSASPPAKALKFRPTASKDGYSTSPSPGSSLPERPADSGGPTPPIPMSGASQNVMMSSRGEGTPATPPRDDGISSTKQQPSHVTAIRSQHSHKTTDARSNLGPVILPTRQQSKKVDTPGIRRVSGKVWALPPVEPVIATSPTSMEKPSSVPFIAIQQLQLEEAFAGPSKDKRSLREIQAEEEARQQEEDFLKWWAAEEERVRLESVVFSKAVAESMAAAGKARRKGRGGKTAKERKPEPLNSPSQGYPKDGLGTGERSTAFTRDQGTKHPRKANPPKT